MKYQHIAVLAAVLVLGYIIGIKYPALYQGKFA